MGSLPLILAQAGSGSGGFGGGGGGGGGGGFGGGSSGSGEGDPIVAVLVFGLFGIFLLYLAIHTVRYRRKLRERDRAVRTASAEAAEDDAYFASDELERHAVALFRAAQMAWDARDRAGRSPGWWGRTCSWSGSAASTTSTRRAGTTAWR